jgi:signal transduction histidine kinase
MNEKSTYPNGLCITQQLEFTATLAGGIAHDFNNLLMSILGNITLARLYIDPECRASRILEKAESTCIQGKELTQQFIMLSKSGSPSKKPSDIAKLLKESAAIGVKDNLVDVVLNFPDSFWRVEVDEDQMRVAFAHLLTNAAESMPDGGKIMVEVRNTTFSSDTPLPKRPVPSGNYLRVTIQDQGQGIASQHLPRVFDPYYTTKELGPRKGMGLGLTTVYAIIDKHGGYVFIDSQVHHGTTVEIFLPVIPDHADSA